VLSNDHPLNKTDASYLGLAPSIRLVLSEADATPNSHNLSLGQSLNMFGIRPE
jgi:hypothetical protein